MKKKKGFTLVELLVVIAILAVLATVSVVGYMGFTKKAQVSNDTSLVSQLNTLLKADEAVDGKPETPTDALKVTEESGYDVTKLTPTTDKYNIVWNKESNQFALLNEEDSPVYGTISEKAYMNWRFVDSYVNTNGFSCYVKGDSKIDSLDVNTGLDVGNNIISTINYVNTSGNEKEIIVRTNSNETVFNVDGITDEVSHYGDANEVNIIRVKMGTYKEFGNIKGNINLAKGKVEMVRGSSATNVVVKELTSNDNTNVTPTQNEVAIVVNDGSDVSTIQSEVDSVEAKSITTGNGTKDVAIIAKDDKNVAYIGAQGYETLRSAVNYSKSGECIVLTKDEEIDQAILIKWVDDDFFITVDLNGHNINSNVGGGSTFIIYVGTLNLKNSQNINGKIESDIDTIAEVGSMNSKTSGHLIVEKNVELKVVGSSRDSYNVKLFYGSTLDIFGKLTNNVGVCISGNGQDNTAKRATTINLHKGAKIKTNKLAIYHPQLGTLNIDGATVEGYAGIGIKSGTLNIMNNAVIKGVANDSALGDQHSSTNGISYDGSAIVMDTFLGYAGNMNVSIVDSTIESLHSYAIKEIKNANAIKSNVVSLSISGDSTIKSANPDTVTGDIYVKEESSVKISSGTFSKEVYAPYIEKGHTVEQSGEVWIVK